MKKIFPIILIAIIFGQMLLPFSIGSGVKGNFGIKSNKVEAAEGDRDWYYIVTTIGSTKIDTPRSNATATSVDADIALDCENARLKSYSADKTNNTQTSKICYAVPHGATINTTGTKLDTNGDAVVPDNSAANSDLPACGIGLFRNSSLAGCIGQILYYILFKPTSFVFGLSGKVLDFTFMYSLKDTSYRSTFVVEGWGIVRDFCNMFFIFVLLYIAIGTILNLNGVKTKEMIISVVIIGLLINFSLFATQVIIDASNILARVFYNPQTIVTGPQAKDATGRLSYDSNGNPIIDSKLGTAGEIKLSEAIVSKVNPQEIISSAQTIQSIPVNSVVGENQEKTAGGISASTFILVVLLATAVNVVGTLAFLSSAFIFIGRVVMLWLAMILAPLAFFSYTVPALQGIKMIGWKNWWKDTLSMAFVAPVFAFFMYIIVGFMGNLGKNMVSADGKTGIDFVVALIVPFMFIMILLMQAKKIAVSMSGEVGATLSKAGAAVGGAALGAGIGLGAMAMRSTIGRAGNAVAENDKTKERASKKGFTGFVNRRLLEVGRGVGGASFDARATKFGAGATKAMEVDAGKAKQGGYKKAKADQVLRSQKRAKDLEVGESSKLKQTLNDHQVALKGVQRVAAPSLDKNQKDLDLARQKALDANSALNADPKNIAKQDAARIASEDVTRLNKERDGINNGGEVLDVNGNGTGKYHTDNGNISANAVKLVDDAQKAATSELILTGNTLKAAKDKVLDTQSSLATAQDANTATNRVGKTPAELLALDAAERKADTAHQQALAEELRGTQAVTTAQNKANNATALYIQYEAERNRVINSGGKLGRSTKEINGDIRTAQTDIDKANTDRHFNDAERITTGINKVARVIAGSVSGAEEAAYNIRMDTKIETK